MTGFTDAEEDEKINFYTMEDDFFSDRINLIKYKGKNINNKYITRKEGVRACLFPTTLNKIDEVDETRVKSPEENNKSPKNINEIIKDENGNVKTCGETEKKTIPQSPHVMWKSEAEVIHIHKNIKQRPKSANSISTSSPVEHNVKKRPSSSYASFNVKPSKIPISKSETPKSVLKKESPKKVKSDSESTSSSSSIHVKRRPSSAGSKPSKGRDCIHRGYSSWEEINSDELDSLIGYEEPTYPVRPTSACGIRTPNFGSDEYLLGRKADWINCLGDHHDHHHHHHHVLHHNPRKCRSNPNISRTNRKQKSTSSHYEKDVRRFRRSLKLLGLEPRDFGIYDSQSDIRKHSGHKPKSKVEPTLNTKVMRRSVSLDCLRETVREASLDDRLDFYHRRLLAQAAYEEWYFKKSEEAHRKREEEIEKAKKIQARLEKEFKERKTKAEEEFQKWIERKRAKMKMEKLSEKSSGKTHDRVIKTKEEAEKAYQEWKKEKDKEMEKKNKLKQEKEEKKAQEERQKEEKKAQAEKAYQEWKRKLEETQKTEAEAKLKKEQKEKEEEEKRKSEGIKLTSFQHWKDIKDREIKIKLQQIKHAARVTNAARSVQVAERLNEAEQAFEEWLDKVELRKRKQYRNIIKNREKAMAKSVPWSMA